MTMEKVRARRSGIPALVALLLLALWSMVVFWSFSEHQRAISAREHELAQRTVAVEEQTLRLFKLAELSILAAANWINEHPKTFPAQDPSFVKLVAEVRRVSGGMLDIRLTDAAGNVYVVPSASRQPVGNVAGHEDIRVQLDPLQRGLYIGNPVLSHVNNQWIIPVTYPVLKADGKLTILAVILELDRIEKTFELQRDKPNGSITILKANGITLFRTPAIAGAIGKSLAKAPDFTEHLSIVERGHYRVKGAFDGVERLVSHARLADYPLIIAVTASLDDVLAPWRNEVTKIAALVLFGTLVTIGMTWYFLRRDKLARERLAQSEQRFRTLLERAPYPIWIIEGNQFVECNEAAIATLGYSSRDELLHVHPSKLSPPRQADGEDSYAKAERMMALAKERGLHRFEWIHTRADGSDLVAEVMLATIELDDRQVIYCAWNDITARKSAEQDMRIAAAAFESQEGMLITDAECVILRVNQAFTRITEFTAQEAVGQTPRLLKSGYQDADFYRAMWESIHRTGAWRGEIWNRRKSGEIYPEWLTITAVKDDAGTTTNYIATLTDITARKEAEGEIKNLAFYDPLTQLPNRRLLLDRLKQALASSTRNEQYGALLYIDLDNFKTLNDTLGHDIGDLLLQQVAQRLTTCVREGDTVARLGGDEFVVMLEYLSENPEEAASHAETVGEKILVTLNQDYQLASFIHHSTPSIGVTLFVDHQGTIEELLKRADLAMYQSKAAGRNTLRFFEPEMQAAVTTRAELENGLREAILNDQFILYYQPQVVGDGRLTGVEALLRWRHPQRGLVSPLEFIPLAEETGLIRPLGNWVLETACAQLTAWADRPEMANLTIAVNVSARQFHHKDFVEEVKAVLDHSGANPRRLKLELTESLLVTDVEDVIAKMSVLKAKGVSFSLDDFGTGYSSLSYLKRLPLDQLKIDQSFVRDILTDPNDAAIAKMIVVLAESLSLAVIAEGVEIEAQRDFLAHQGCHAYQGYMFSRPLPLHEFEAFVKEAELASD